MVINLLSLLTQARVAKAAKKTLSAMAFAKNAMALFPSIIRLGTVVYKK